MNLIALLKQEQFAGTEDDTDKLIHYFYKKHIRVTYFDDRTAKHAPRRFIFTANKQCRHLKKDGEVISASESELIDECNGIILQGSDWKICAIPPPFVRTQFSPDVIDEGLANKCYRIFEIEDGSLITLYNWEHVDEKANPWKISTHSGIDVTNQARANLTFRQMIDDVLAKNGISVDEFYNLLDKTRSYSFIVKHPDIHFFQEGTKTDIYKITFVQSNDLTFDASKKLIDLHSPHPKIGTQKEVTTKEIDNPVVLPDGSVISRKDKLPITKIQTLTFLASTALEWYVKHGTICYGFTLRSTDIDKTGNHSNILIESTLYQALKGMVYDLKLPAQFACRKQSSKALPVHMCALYAYLNKQTQRQTFISLFPQYEQMYKSFEGIIGFLQKSVIDIMNKKPVQDECYAKHASYLATQITLRTSAKAVVAGFITDPRFVHIYESLYQHEIEKKKQ